MGLFSIFKKGSAPAYSCYRYKVTGINPASGRKKNVFVIAASNAAPEAVASKSGLLAPYNVELAQEAPTARQLELVKKSGLPCLQTHQCWMRLYLFNGLLMVYLLRNQRRFALWIMRSPIMYFYQNTRE